VDLALKRFGWVFLVFLVAVACEFSAVDRSDRDPPTQTTAPVDLYSVYFSDPGGPTSKTLRGGPDRSLATAIRQARASVDVAVYQLDLWSLRDALIDAHRRGIAVRMVTDSDNLDEAEVQQMKEAGIPVLGDRREGLMHNKFVVIDRQEVWTGSMNFTINDVYRNDNNLVRFRSAQLAQDYTAEFEEMFVEDHFGPGLPANTPHPSVSLEGSLVEVFFSPDDGVEQRLVDLVEAAQESVYFLAFSFTSDELATAMLERAHDGVTVAGVFEASQYQTNSGTEFDHFVKAGLDVRLDGNPDNMHHKVILIDERIVVTGSYNFSYNAETRNDENLLIIHDSGIALLYLAEFKRVFVQAKD